MKKFGLLLISAGLLSFGLISFRTADKSVVSSSYQVSWGKLGERTIEGTDNGMTTLTANAGNTVKAIKIKVVKGGVNLHRCEVWFNNGSKKSIELRNDVPAGTESREINLIDNNEQVSKVIFWYDTRNYGKQGAAVELWGKRLDS